VIASAIEALGQTVNQVALAIGMSRSGLGLVVNEKRPVTPDTALRVATYFGTGVGGAKLLLGLQTDFDLWQAQAALRGALKEIIPATLPRAPQPSALKALRQGVRDQSGRHQST
jgi:addiction module HigA family antidote